VGRRSTGGLSERPWSWIANRRDAGQQARLSARPPGSALPSLETQGTDQLNGRLSLRRRRVQCRDLMNVPYRRSSGVAAPATTSRLCEPMSRLPAARPKRRTVSGGHLALLL
jgi:hypothetical protein